MSGKDKGGGRGASGDYDGQRQRLADYARCRRDFARPLASALKPASFRRIGRPTCFLNTPPRWNRAAFGR